MDKQSFQLGGEKQIFVLPRNIQRLDPHTVASKHDTLGEALRAFGEKLAAAGGTGRLQGNAVQDLFADAPYGWAKDTTGYVFAGGELR